MMQRQSAAVWLLLLLLIGVPLLGAAPPAAAAPAAPQAELITNGGFDAGATGWTQYSSAGSTLIGAYCPGTRTNCAWFGAKNNTEDRLSQKITIPAGVSARLSFWWTLETDELGTAADTFRVNLLNSTGGLIRTLATFDNSTLDEYTWDNPVFDISSYAGQTVQVQFVGKTDAINASSFWLDDVSVQTGGAYKKTRLPYIRR